MELGFGRRPLFFFLSECSGADRPHPRMGLLASALLVEWFSSCPTLSLVVRLPCNDEMSPDVVGEASTDIGAILNFTMSCRVDPLPLCPCKGTLAHHFVQPGSGAFAPDQGWRPSESGPPAHAPTAPRALAQITANTGGGGWASAPGATTAHEDPPSAASTGGWGEPGGWGEVPMSGGWAESTNNTWGTTAAGEGSDFAPSQGE